MSKYPRSIHFEGILNFRDLGGYKARCGRTVAWRRIYRSGEMHHMTGRDASRLKEEIRLNTVIDLRSTRRVKRTGDGLLDEVGAKYNNLAFTKAEGDDTGEQHIFEGFSNSGELYFYRARLKDYGRQIVNALEIIADVKNHPLVFHCNAGKDRSGTLAAVLLSALGVADKDIVNDYALTDRSMKAFLDRWNNDPETAEVHKNLPEYHLKATPESMVLFLAALKKEYGSAEGYLKYMGAENSLVELLENALLV